jgi:hypothetical protein
MMAIQVSETVDGDLAEPSVKLDGPVAEIFLSTLVRDDQHILDDIRRIDPGGKFGVQPDRYQFPDPLAIPSEQLVGGLGTATCGGLKQLVGV